MNQGVSFGFPAASMDKDGSLKVTLNRLESLIAGI